MKKTLTILAAAGFADALYPKLLRRQEIQLLPPGPLFNKIYKIG